MSKTNNDSPSLPYEVSLSPEGLLFRSTGAGLAWGVTVASPVQGSTETIVTLFNDITTQTDLIKLIYELSKLIDISANPAKELLTSNSISVLYAGDNITSFSSIEELVKFYMKSVLAAGGEIDLINTISDCETSATE
jgi:hypothetical protein